MGELQHVKRGTWSEDEDAKLRQLVKEHTSIHGGNLLGIWNGISRDMGFGRNPKQCRERWTHFLDPSLKIGEWSMEEDHKLMKMYDEQGRKWSAIAKELPAERQDESSVARNHFSAIVSGNLDGGNRNNSHIVRRF